MGETHELFVVWALSLVWFAGATPDSKSLDSINLVGLHRFRKLENAVAVSKAFAGVLEESWKIFPNREIQGRANHEVQTVD